MKITSICLLFGSVTSLPPVFRNNDARMGSLVKRETPVTVDQTSKVPLPGLTQSQNITTPLSTSSNASSGVSPGAIGNALPIVDDPVDCHNLSTGMSNKCWSELNLTDYVNEWSQKPNCPTHLRARFFDCFLHDTPSSAMNCSSLAPGHCPVPRFDLSKPYDARQLYVVYNIYSINNFFLNWYQSISGATGAISENIPLVVQVLDPDKKQFLDLQILLIILQGIFSLIPGAFGIAWAASTIGWQIGAQVVSNAVAVAPLVGRALFPVGNEKSRVIQMAALGAEFAQLVLTVQGNLEDAFSLVAGNMNNFLAFAQQGIFCLSNNTNPASDTEYMVYSFNTFIISQALKRNNVHAVVARDTNPQQLATNGSRLAYDIDCRAYDEYGLCDAWWYSKNYMSAFTLDNFGEMSRNYRKELRQLFSAGLTTGQLLFENALACQIQGNTAKPVNLTIYAGGLNAACLSQLPMLTWDQSCHADLLRLNPKARNHRNLESETRCEFLEQPKQPGFVEKDSTDYATGPRYYVPTGYLGPLIHIPGIIERGGLMFG